MLRRPSLIRNFEVHLRKLNLSWETMLLGNIAKRLAVYFLVLLLGPVPAWARPTTDGEAQRSVAGWLALDQRPLRARMGAKTALVKAFKDSAGNIDYFVVSLEPSGFAIVAGDDLLEPIIAFAPQGAFDPVPQNPLYVLLNRDLPGRLAEVRKKEDQARAQGQKYTPLGLHRRARGKWELLQKTDTGAPTMEAPSVASVSDLRVGPLVQSKWSQDYEGTPTQYCYNYYTPYHYVCGCVATALAQLLRFFSLPVDRVGTPSFTIHVNNVQKTASLRGGDGAGGPYDWNNMVLDPDANTTEIQRQAIGALTYDAGVAVHMWYAADGSGAYTWDACRALLDTFGYNNAKYGNNWPNGSIPSANLNNMINPNLDAQFPAILGITDNKNNGHEIIVDGYGYNVSTLYHHLNLGWAGSADAWYNLPTITAGGYNFNSVDDCVYNVFPQGSGEIISGRVLDTAGQPVSGATITATRTGGGSYSATSNSQGIYALAKIPGAATYTITASKPGYGFLAQTVSTGTSNNDSTVTGNLWGIDLVQNSSSPLITLNQALDNNSLAFTTGGDASWSGQTGVSFYGGSSAQSGALGASQSSWLQTTVVGPGTLSFNWKVSSDANHDFLEVLMDNGLQPGAISGEVGWQQQNLSIPAGSHIIKWIYSKDAAASAGSDCGWVDQVSFISSRKVPILPALQLLLGND
jgi:hypothetical protein